MAGNEQKYMNIFKAEAEEHLTSLSAGLLNLEADPSSADKEQVHELLRNAHTLKGSARMLGLSDIGEIAHHMEDLFKAIEADEMKPEPEIIDALLSGTDSIRDIISCVSEGKASGVDVKAMVARLTNILQGGEKQPAGEEPGDTADDSPQQETRHDELEEHAPTTAPVAKPEPPVAREPSPPKPESAPPSTPVQGVQAPSTHDLQTIRVEAGKLDDLLDMAGELMISKIKLEGRLRTIKDILGRSDIFSKLETSGNDGNGLGRAAGELRTSIQDFYHELNEDIIELDLFAQEIVSHTLGLRVLPASLLFEKYHRMVRDMARELGKKIKLEITGGDTELDKQIIEELNPVMMHLVRNACDHGIEEPYVRELSGKPAEGKISINAFHKGNNVVIEIFDDGYGIDPNLMRKIAADKGIMSHQAAEAISDEEARYLIFKQGFTSSKIITDISGRGVGMDVVRNNMEKVKGDIVVDSEPGKFTKITLTAPLTLSIMNALLIMCNDDVFAIPLTFVEETIRLDISKIQREAGREVFNVRGSIVPLIRMSEMLGLSVSDAQKPKKFLSVVVLRFRNQRIGLIVDRYLRDQEVVVKNLGNHLVDVDFVAGATILRRGEPALILNIFDVFQAAEGSFSSGIVQAYNEAQESIKPPKILVVDDSITTRIMEKGVLETAGYEVDLATTGEEALEKLDVATFDLVVSDVEMPGINGFELTEKIRNDERFKDLPVVIVTSLASDEHKRRGIEVGARAYIVKGTFEHNQLLSAVRSLVGESGREEK